MIHENFRLCRMYCGYSIAQVAKATGIPADRYRDIETGDVQPDRNEIERIAAIFNIEPVGMLGTMPDIQKYIVNQSVDANVYSSSEGKESIIEYITSLTDDEKQLLLLLRSVKNKSDALEKIEEILSSMDKI